MQTDITSRLQICDSVGWHNLASGDTNRLEQRVGQSNHEQLSPSGISAS